MNDIVFRKNPRAKHLRITVKPDSSVRVTIPRFCTLQKAKLFEESRQEWILEQQNKFQQRKSLYTHDAAEIEALRKKAKAYIPDRVAELADEFGFQYNEVRIKNITSRWGSCSSKKNLNFSLHLMQFEKKYIDYVILHELCHTKQMNHGPKFWALVEKVCPGGKQIDKEMRKLSRSVD